jgi:hypothetical protein
MELSFFNPWWKDGKISPALTGRRRADEFKPIVHYSLSSIANTLISQRPFYGRLATSARWALFFSQFELSSWQSGLSDDGLKCPGT